MLFSQLENVAQEPSVSNSSESMKRPAGSPAANADKKGRLNDKNGMRLVVKRPGIDVNSEFFGRLMAELVTQQIAIPLDQQQPVFLGSGIDLGSLLKTDSVMIG